MIRSVFSALLLTGMLQTPLFSAGTITLGGQVYPTLSLSGSPNQSLVGSNGTMGTHADVDQPNESVNFGDLSLAAGPVATASFGLRVRGNTACKVTSSVLSYTASNLKYAGTLLVGNASELGFVSLSSGPVSNGVNGDSSGLSYGSKFLGGNTLASLNSGAVGPATATSDKFISLISKPSLSGNTSSPDNWVEGTVNYSVPTGSAWECTGASGTFNIVNTFNVFPGA